MTAEEFQNKSDSIREIDSLQKQINEIREDQKKFVTWTLFWSITGVIIALAGYLTVQVNAMQIKNAILETNLQTINSSIVSLAQSIDKHEDSVKK